MQRSIAPKTHDKIIAFIRKSCRFEQVCVVCFVTVMLRAKNRNDDFMIVLIFRLQNPHQSTQNCATK